jgi:hypothetical protein
MSDLETGAAVAAPDTTAIADTQTVADKPVNTMDALTDSLSAAYDKINPPRSEAGQFAAKDKPAEAGAETGDAKPEISDQTQTQTIEPPKAAIEAPVSWSADMKAKWAALPPEAQQYVAQRESEAHKRISELGQTAKAHESFRQVAEQYDGVFRRYNVPPHVGFAQLVEGFLHSENDPLGFAVDLLKKRGIDPSNLIAGAKTGEGDESGVVRSLNAKLDAQARELAELRTKFTAKERTEQEQTQATLNRQIQDFAKDKPHFEAVRRHMAGLLDSGAAESLEAAYEQAIYAVPDIRKSILDEERKADEAKRADETKKKAEEAKKAASINVRSPRGGNPTRKGNWEDTLREVGERIAG